MILALCFFLVLGSAVCLLTMRPTFAWQSLQQSQWPMLLAGSLCDAVSAVVLTMLILSNRQTYSLLVYLFLLSLTGVAYLWGKWMGKLRPAWSLYLSAAMLCALCGSFWFVSAHNINQPLRGSVSANR